MQSPSPGDCLATVDLRPAVACSHAAPAALRCLLLQGTLLFCLLLLAIWAPLLLFSSGAPTYQTPGIASAHVNASIGVVTSYGHYQGAVGGAQALSLLHACAPTHAGCSVGC